jgi:hypothetical protein
MSTSMEEANQLLGSWHVVVYLNPVMGFTTLDNNGHLDKRFFLYTHSNKFLTPDYFFCCSVHVWVE